MRPGGAVETRDREIIKALPEIFTDLSRRGRRIVGLFTKDPRTLLQLVSTTTQETGEVRREVRFANSYPEYEMAKKPRRASDNGTWRSKEKTEIYNEHGNRIGFMTRYDYVYKPGRNGGHEQGPNLGLREYAYYPVGFNEHSLCVVYEKRAKKVSRHNSGEGSSVEQQPNLQVAPPLRSMTASAGAFAVVAAAVAEGWDLLNDFSENDFWSMDFSDEGWKDSCYDHRIYQRHI